MAGRTLFIGDVHGCYHELVELLERSGHRREDRVVMLGDLVNKGPEVVRCLEFVWRSGFECLLGNHEAHFLLHARSQPAYRAVWDRLDRELQRWLAGLPLYIDEPRFLAVHAGLRPGVPLHLQSREDLLNIRECKTGRAGEGERAPWYDFYDGSKPVIYGHWARQGLRLGERTIGLDSGCVYGGKLSAWILETQTLVQVDARRVYEIPGKQKRGNP